MAIDSLNEVRTIKSSMRTKNKWLASAINSRQGRENGEDEDEKNV